MHTNGQLATEEGGAEVEVKARYSALPPQENGSSHAVPSNNVEEDKDEHLYDRPASVICTVMIREPLPTPPPQMMYDQPRVPSEMSNGASLSPPIARAESFQTRENVAYCQTSDLDIVQRDSEEDGSSDYTGDSMQYVAAYGKPLPLGLLYRPLYGSDGTRIDYAHPRM